MNSRSITSHAVSEEGAAGVDENSVTAAVEEQRRFFRAGNTLDVDVRIRALMRLAECIRSNEGRILDALSADLGKPPVEAYATEIGVVLKELRVISRGVRKWARARRIRTPLEFAVSSSRTIPEPYGVTLVISPWNYPFQLSLAPAIGALAAGNTVILKPSEIAPHVASTLRDIIHDAFDPALFRVIEGDSNVASELLDQRFDYIFYTGNARVGKIVLRKAAANLVPATLELGGKSPCIVTGNADIAVAAQRIAWGKFINAGQTCVAPDYCLVHSSLYEQFLEELKRATNRLYGPNPMESADYGRIVNDKHVQRLAELLDGDKTLVGGDIDRQQRYVAPTVLRDISWDHPSMHEEIFGPILPIIAYSSIDECCERVGERARPLALYVFSEDTREARTIMRRLSFGGGCVNDTVVHVANPWLPFGGVGESGMGRYRGKESFETFSYLKSIVEHRSRPDFSLRYPPYRGKLKWFKKFLG